MFFGTARAGVGVPTGTIEQQDGVRARSDGAGDLVEVKLHGVGVGVGQRQGGPRAAGRQIAPNK